MTGSLQRAASHLAAAALSVTRRRARRADGDTGFVLLESIMAITIITIVMGGLATFFVNGVKSTNQQRARQTATQLADSAVESIRSLHASDLLRGRGSSAVHTQFTSAPAAAATAVGTMSEAFDSTASATAGATATVPTVPVVQKVNKINYSVSKILGWCATLPSSTSGGCDKSLLPIAPATNSNIRYLRAVVAVTWPDGHCDLGVCAYVTGTLVSTADDLTFNLNESPPVAPVVTAPAAQTSLVNDVVSLPVAVKTGTGVPTFTWAASGLPSGLSIDQLTGVISGTVGATTGTFSATVTVTDGFARPASAPFTWTVLPAITITTPANQTSTVGTAIATVTLTASGGSGAPFTWTDPGKTLPPGLTLAASSGTQATITGTPTAGGTFTVKVTATDAASHSATVTWNWTVGYAPLVVGDPGPQTSTLGNAVTAQNGPTLSASGGSLSYSWALTSGSSLPAGLTLSTSGVVTGTPTALGAKTVSVTVTDLVLNISRSISFTWTVYAAPTVTAPAAQKTTVGAAFSLQLATTCPNQACTYKLNNGPTGISIDNNGLMSGTVGTPAGSFTSTVTVTDHSGAAVTSAAFTWTVNPALAITTPGTQTVFVNQRDSLDMSTFVTGGTSTFTYSASALPSGLSINTSTGLISGTVTSTRGTTSVVITVKDSANVVVSTNTFKWIVTDLRLDIPDQWTAQFGSGSLDIDNWFSGGTGTITYSVSIPNGSWLGYTSSSHVISGTAPSSKSVTAITVTLSDTTGASVSYTFNWWVASLRMTTIPDQVTPFNTAISPAFDLDNYFTTTATSITVSATPPGLTYSTTTHAFTGTTQGTASATTITVTGKDSSGFATTQTFTWYVTDLKWKTFTAPASIRRNIAITPVPMSGNVQGGTSPYTYSATGLPTGLVIDPGTGIISGTATTLGTYATVKITATDLTGASVTTTFSWTVTT